MKKKKKRMKMPSWIWRLERKELNLQVKDFLRYIWYCGDRGCRDWDYWLSGKYKVTERTIRRWIKQLRDMRLVNVQCARTQGRTIYRLPYYDKPVWLYKKGEISLSQMRHLRENIRETRQKRIQDRMNKSRTKMSYISIAQQKKNSTSSSSSATAGLKKDVSPPQVNKDTEKHGEESTSGRCPEPRKHQRLDLQPAVQWSRAEIDNKFDKMLAESKTKDFIKSGHKTVEAKRIAEAIVAERRAKINEGKQRRKG